MKIVVLSLDGGLLFVYLLLVGWFKLLCIILEKKSYEDVGIMLVYEWVCFGCWWSWIGWVEIGIYLVEYFIMFVLRYYVEDIEII